MIFSLEYKNFVKKEEKKKYFSFPNNLIILYHMDNINKNSVAKATETSSKDVESLMDSVEEISNLNIDIKYLI